MTDAAFSALASLANPSLLIMLAVGVVAGLVIGLIPGLGGTGAVAILLPVTFGMEPEQALALLIGALAVVHTSDTVSAVLLGAPGSASASVTMMDGYSMARKGQAKRALSLAFLSSMAGGLIGAVGLTLAIPLARPLVLSFGSPELFMLTILGVSLAAVLSRGNVVKGLAAGLLGLLLGMVGTSPTTAEERFTFGSLFLGDGVSLVAVALGIFGLAEIASRVGQRRVDGAAGRARRRLGGRHPRVADPLDPRPPRRADRHLGRHPARRRRHRRHLAGLRPGRRDRQGQAQVRQGRPPRHRRPRERQQLRRGRRPDPDVALRHPRRRALGDAARHAADLRHPAGTGDRHRAPRPDVPHRLVPSRSPASSARSSASSPPDAGQADQGAVRDPRPRPAGRDAARRLPGGRPARRPVGHGRPGCRRLVPQGDRRAAGAVPHRLRAGHPDGALLLPDHEPLRRLGLDGAPRRAGLRGDPGRAAAVVAGQALRRPPGRGRRRPP